MITLCGFSASNYYNKVKLALLEKGVPFQESEVWTSEVDTHPCPSKDIFVCSYATHI